MNRTHTLIGSPEAGERTRLACRRWRLASANFLLCLGNNERLDVPAPGSLRRPAASPSRTGIARELHAHPGKVDQSWWTRRLVAFFTRGDKRRGRRFYLVFRAFQQGQAISRILVGQLPGHPPRRARRSRPTRHLTCAIYEIVCRSSASLGPAE